MSDHTLEVPRVYVHQETPGKPFRPSNGQDGRIFQDWFCDRCNRDHVVHAHGDFENGCPLLAAAMAFDAGEDGYPSEWVIAEDGYPTCTAFDPGCCE